MRDPMKHIKQMLLITFALLAPLAARADMIYWTPPNTYEGFLYDRGYSREIVKDISSNAVLYGLPICIGMTVVAVLFLRMRKKRFPKAKTAIVVLIFICVAVGLGVDMIKYLANDNDDRKPVLFMRGPPPDYSPVYLDDTDEHRAEYDRYCIQWYDSWELSRSGDILDEEPLNHGGCHVESWIRRYDGTYIRDPGPPDMRKGAPEAVINAYQKFKEKLYGGQGAFRGRHWNGAVSNGGE